MLEALFAKYFGPWILSSTDRGSPMLILAGDSEGHNTQGNEYEPVCSFWSHKSQYQAVSRVTNHGLLISCNSYHCYYCSPLPIIQLFRCLAMR